MINEIIREVELCLDNGCYMAGLTLALTLPDICGKAYYPTLTPSERYVNWFNEYIGQYEQSKRGKEIGVPYLSGELVYSLRNSILHQGNPNIDGKKLDIIYFELLYSKYEGASCIDGRSEARLETDDKGKEKAVDKKYSVRIRDLCWKICVLAEDCYNKDKEKFNFFNYNIVNMDFGTRKLFGIKKGDIR